MYLLSKEKYDRLNKRLTSRETDTCNNKTPQVGLSTSQCGEYESPSSNENPTIPSAKSRINPDFISKNMLGDRLYDSGGLETRVSSSDCSTLWGNEKKVINKLLIRVRIYLKMTSRVTTKGKKELKQGEYKILNKRKDCV